MINRKQKASIILAAIILFTGCSTLTNSNEAYGGRSSGDRSSEDVQTMDWNESFVPGPLQDGEGLYVVGYMDLEHQQPENVIFHNTPTYRTDQDTFYNLQDYYTEQGTEAFLEVYPADGKGVEQIRLDTTCWELADGMIWSFDRTENGYVFLVGADKVKQEEGNMLCSHIYAVYTDSQCAVLSKTDLTPALQEKHAYEQVAANRTEILCDGNGFLYLLTDMNQRLFVLDKEGQYVTEFCCSGSGEDSVSLPARDDIGRLIFPVTYGIEHVTKLYGLAEGGSFRELSSLDGMKFGRWYAMWGSDFYYAAEEELIRWNVRTGEQQKLMNLKEAGFSQVESSTYLVAGDGQKKYLRVCTGAEDYVLTLSEEAIVYSNPVRFAMLGAESNYLKGCLANFSRKNPRFSILIEDAGGDSEAYRDRLMADMVSGNGPDILYLSYEDMELLAEVGALLDLSQLISQKTLDQVLPGVIKLGTVQDQLVGIAPSMQVRTMFTYSGTWNKSGWNLDDVLELAEEREGLEGIFTYPMGGMPASNVLYSLIGRDLDHSRFIDWENKSSRFEQGNFMQVLELVKHYEPAGSISNIDGEQKVLAGDFLAEDWPVFSPSQYFSIVAELSEQGVAVGFPSELGQGSYIMADGILVVNADTENKEAAAAFLEYILSQESQLTLNNSLSVLSDIMDIAIVYNEFAGHYLWKNASGSSMILETGPDGTLPFEEYKAFLHSCVPYRGENPLYDIISEEAQDYLYGDKDALTVTRIIDNRIQGYLDELN